MCLNLCILSALLLAILYLFFGAYDLIFPDIYGFNLWQTGLAFVGIGVGMLIAISTDLLYGPILGISATKLTRSAGRTTIDAWCKGVRRTRVKSAALNPSIACRLPCSARRWSRSDSSGSPLQCETSSIGDVLTVPLPVMASLGPSTYCWLTTDADSSFSDTRTSTGSSLCLAVSFSGLVC